MRLAPLVFTLFLVPSGCQLSPEREAYYRARFDEQKAKLAELKERIEAEKALVSVARKAKEEAAARAAEVAAQVDARDKEVVALREALKRGEVELRTFQEKEAALIAAREELGRVREQSARAVEEAAASLQKATEVADTKLLVLRAERDDARQALTAAEQEHTAEVIKLTAAGTGDALTTIGPIADKALPGAGFLAMLIGGGLQAFGRRRNGAAPA